MTDKDAAPTENPAATTGKQAKSSIWGGRFRQADHPS